MPNSRKTGWIWLWALVLAALTVPGGLLRAQAPAPAGPPQAGAAARKIGTISIRFIGIANVSEQIVRTNMQLREGNDFDPAILDRDIRSLYRTGLFEFIEIKQEDTPEGRVNLVVEVTPKYRVSAVRFQGNKQVKSRRLQDEVTTRANSALDERTVKDDAGKIHEYYQKSGYNQAQVSYDIERDRATGYGTVIFKIREGGKVRIGRINFDGNQRIKSSTLRGKMETKKWGLFSWIMGTGYYKDEKFEDDINKLLDYYREHGFLDAEIPLDQISYDYPSKRRMVITVHVDEGRQYRIGDISIAGGKLYPEALLNAVVAQKSGSVYNPTKLDKDVEALEDFYGRDGYLETRVRLVRKPNVATGNIDLEYQVNESERFLVESVKIEGNDNTKSIVVLRELLLGPGDVFNTVLMKRSKVRLENTRFFEEVNTTPESTNIPGRRNLKISVREERTGNLSFGAGFNSIEKGVLFAEISQSNFDLFNRRSFFQGDGQKFRLKFQIGSQSSEVLLAFEEPWLFERQLALGFTVYRVSSDYNSAFYEEVRTGGEIHLRKLLFEYVEGTFSYTYEVVDIRNIDPSASAVFQSLAGTHTTSKFGLQLLRDTRDRLINTTSGSRLEFITEVAGGPLGGNTDYYRLEARAAHYVPIFRFQTQVFGIDARLGSVKNFGESIDVPFYDRYFLGGPQTLRGFEFREVGPKDSFGEPVGGKSYGFLSLEYSIAIVGQMRFAVFYDAGFVNYPSYDFNPANYNDNWGFGIRMFIAGAPANLDFGIPITTDKINKKGSQFNFSFGSRF